MLSKSNRPKEFTKWSKAHTYSFSPVLKEPYFQPLTLFSIRSPSSSNARSQKEPLPDIGKHPPAARPGWTSAGSLLASTRMARGQVETRPAVPVHPPSANPLGKSDDFRARSSSESSSCSVLEGRAQVWRAVNRKRDRESRGLMCIVEGCRRGVSFGRWRGARTRVGRS